VASCPLLAREGLMKRNVVVFKVPLFLREGFRVSSFQGHHRFKQVTDIVILTGFIRFEISIRQQF